MRRLVQTQERVDLILDRGCMGYRTGTMGFLSELRMYGVLGSWTAEMCGPSCFFAVLKARNGFFLDEPAQLRFREAFRFNAPVYFSEGDHPVCEVLEVYPKVGAPVLFAGSFHSGLAKLPVAHEPKAEHLLHQPLVYRRRSHQQAHQLEEIEDVLSGLVEMVDLEQIVVSLEEIVLDVLGGAPPRL